MLPDNSQTCRIAKRTTAFSAVLLLSAILAAPAQAEDIGIITLVPGDDIVPISLATEGNSHTCILTIKIYPIPGDDETFVTAADVWGCAGDSFICNQLNDDVPCSVESSTPILFHVEDGAHIGSIQEARLLIDVNNDGDPEYNLPAVYPHIEL